MIRTSVLQHMVESCVYVYFCVHDPLPNPFISDEANCPRSSKHDDGSNTHMIL